MPESIEQILAQCQFFAQIDESRRRRLAQITRIHRFRKGQAIFRQGDACPGIYIVCRGMVRIFKIAPNGKEHVLHMVGPGSTFAEVAAIGGFDCPANAEAIADSSCALVPLEPFRQAMAEDHQLCQQMITGLSFWVRQLLSLLEDLVLRDATGRITRFLLESEPDADGAVKLPALKRHVASHLNLTSETFSRTFSRLIEAGMIVELDNNRVQLVDLPRLRAAIDGPFPEI
ncbi:MAG: Crp/Fnr family transcriptional regulator [Planctomycetes bacterium]|nr:Crp/Fnr family transcriptional regulator [Planctomycetota bacterium]